MSEFIEVQAVTLHLNMDGPGKRMIDAKVRTINRDQVCSADPATVAGCVEVKLSDGQRVFVRGSVESVTGLKPKSEPKKEAKKEKETTKVRGITSKRSKW
jgi:hypothetical protein